MGRKFAQVQTSIWRDADFVALPSQAQRLYLLLLSQADITMCGVVPYMPERWTCMAPDVYEADIFSAVESLEAGRFVQVDRRTQELWVRSFILHNVHGKLNTKGAVAAFEEVLSIPLRRGICETYPTLLNTPSKGLQAVDFEVAEGA